MLTPEQYISWYINWLDGKIESALQLQLERLDTNNAIFYSGMIEAYKQARDNAIRIKMEEK